TGLYEYKVSGIVRSPPDLLADVYMDLDYRKQWDQYVQELREIKVDGEDAVYWQMKYPFPMSNRDISFPKMKQRRQLDFEGRKVHVILAESISVPWFSEKSGMIRVKQYKQSLAIQSYDSWRSEGKYRAYVGASTWTTHVKATLIAGLSNAGCFFPEVGDWAWVPKNQRRLTSPQKLGYNARWMFKSDESILY
ncbi:hypothetical protein FD755_020718, partial [Muntiacus reevesi]